MKQNQKTQLYAGVWIVITLFLLALLWQNIGSAREINHSTLIRGSTQQLLKGELSGHPDDPLIESLDQMMDGLRAEDGSSDFQDRLTKLMLLWEDIKQEIEIVREDSSQSGRLYELSQEHFDQCNDLVYSMQENFENKLWLSIGIYCVCLLFSLTYFTASSKHNKKNLEESFSVDQLTGLLSRRGFEVKAGNVLRKAAGQTYVMIEFDVINFRSVNQTYGYEQGDQLLKNIASAVEDWSESNAVCGRINADEFVLLCAERESLITALNDQLMAAMKSQNESAALGIAGFTYGAYKIENGNESIKTIMDKANTAHRIAKQSKKRLVMWYDEALIKKIEKEKQYIERMESALLANEFEMYLQVKVELATMKSIGAEALVRWNIPGKGLVFPDEFIPLFEMNGSIMELDYYMLAKACEYIRAQLDQGKPGITISVNFSRVTINHERFYERVVETVDRFQLPHSYIEVEVTERSFNEVTDTVLQVVSQLMDAGFYISMDDFGTGHSNLNMLSRLPIHIMKLDRAFLREIEQNKKTRGLLSSMVDIAHAMGLKVVCEGVEQEEDVRILRHMGCDYAQGYFFSKPVPASEFERFSHSYDAPESLSTSLASRPSFAPIHQETFNGSDNLLEETLLGTYPGFLSLRNEKHEIVYLNDNFRKWIRQFTDVDPLGRTNVELAAIVPENVADTFLQCHDGSMELQRDTQNRTGLKKVIEFHGGTGSEEDDQYLDVLKYWVVLNGEAYIFTIAYDVTDLYVENLRNLQSSMTDSLTGARNRRYMQAELNRYEGHYAAILNLDHFKMLNAREGYMTGDRILKEFVSFIRTHTPGIITIIRLGGAEFLVIFEKDLTQEQINDNLERTREQYEQAYAKYSYLSFRKGVDLISTNLDETLRQLDKKMCEERESLEDPG